MTNDMSYPYDDTLLRELERGPTNPPLAPPVAESPQAQVNAEYFAMRNKALAARNEHLFRLIMEANMYLAVHDEKRAMQVLSQALTS